MKDIKNYIAGAAFGLSLLLLPASAGAQVPPERALPTVTNTGQTRTIYRDIGRRTKGKITVLEQNAKTLQEQVEKIKTVLQTQGTVIEDLTELVNTAFPSYGSLASVVADADPEVKGLRDTMNTTCGNYTQMVEDFDHEFGADGVKYRSEMHRLRTDTTMPDVERDIRRVNLPERYDLAKTNLATVKVVCDTNAARYKSRFAERRAEAINIIETILLPTRDGKEAEFAWQMNTYNKNKPAASNFNLAIFTGLKVNGHEGDSAALNNVTGLRLTYGDKWQASVDIAGVFGDTITTSVDVNALKPTIDPLDHGYTANSKITLTDEDTLDDFLKIGVGANYAFSEGTSITWRSGFGVDIVFGEPENTFTTEIDRTIYNSKNEEAPGGSHDRSSDITDKGFKVTFVPKLDLTVEFYTTNDKSQCIYLQATAGVNTSTGDGEFVLLTGYEF